MDLLGDGVKRSTPTSPLFGRSFGWGCSDPYAQGWADVDELLTKLGKYGKNLSFDQLRIIVATNNKKRFSFSEDQTRIRANQGHSINIELGLLPSEPPEYLYHGTATRFLESIREEGLLKKNRQHVHLSQDKETATKVGSRHGKPIVLVIRSEAMQADGYNFFLSDNNVWLTENVPAEYIQ